MSRKIRAKNIGDRRFVLFEGRRYNLALNPASVSTVVKNNSSFSNRYDSIISSLSLRAKFYLFEGVYSLAELELRMREVDNFHIYISSMLERIVEPTHKVFSSLKMDESREFLSAVDAIEADDKKRAFLNYIQGVYFLGRYDFNLAIPKFRTAVKQDPLNPKYRNEIIFSYIKLGEFKKAKDEGENALSALKSTANTSELAINYVYLMITYDKLGDFTRAKVCKQRAENLGFSQGRYEWDNFRYAKTLRLLGDALYCWGQYDQSRAYYSRGLTFNSRMVNENRSLLLDLDLLCASCDVWLKTGKIAKASQYAEKAEKLLDLWVRGKSFRRGWLQTLKGRIKEIEGKYEQAGVEYCCAEEELAGSVGSLHIISAVAGADYARCSSKGKLAQNVRGKLSSFASACKAGLITKDNDKFNSIFSFARIAKNLGKYKLAIKFYKKAIAKYSVEFGKFSFKVFTAQKSLAKCYYALKKKGKTKKYILSALETYRHLGLPAYPELVTLYILYGDCLFLEKDTTSAVRAYEKSLEMASPNFGGVNSLTEKVYRKLSKVYEKLAVYDKAILYFNEVLNFVSKNSQRKDEELISDYSYLGSLWEKSGNLYKAKQYYTRVYQNCLKNLGVSAKESDAAKKQLERIIAKMDKK